MTRPCSMLFAFVALLVLTISFDAKRAVRKRQISDFGKTADGTSVYCYVLTNDKGAEAVVISYGATLVSLRVPDRKGKIGDVFLDYNSLDGYEQGTSNFGGTIGRYGHRIAGGQFTLDGKVFHVPTNDGPNSLHGGTIGFEKRVRTAVDRSQVDAGGHKKVFAVARVLVHEELRHGNKKAA